ncbi:uncharacterized protein LOC134032841 [Osmerus eperlanus]|uniref:uncharacterized protein LOC134032841 n=1 Tax=Osmerus eperlanus TaxID=29151 RepID=UPI002E0EB08B
MEGCRAMAGPGSSPSILAELQRQQRCSQYCDTLLRAGGVSVPAHSCILSALCPQLSCVLSSTPPSSSGQSNLVEFQAFGACALLRLVGLLYSGEMVVEGEVEREEVMAAAAKLGISGLVEVGRSEVEDGAQSWERDRRAGPSSTEGQRWKERVREVGVQTEPLDNRDDHVARRKSGGRDSPGGDVTERHNGRETPAGFNADAGIQTCGAIMDISHQPLCLQSLGGEGPVCVRAAEEHPQISTFYSSSSTLNPDPLVSYVGDVTLLQEAPAPGSMGAVDLPPHIPCIPLSLLCPLDGHQAPDISSMLTTRGEPTEATRLDVIPPSLSSSSPSLIPSSTPAVYMSGHGMEAFPPSASSPPQAVDLLEGEGEEFEQFRGNIPGFISYFLNPAHFQDGEREGRRRRRRRAAGGAERGAEERRAQKPRGRRRGGDVVGTTAANKEQVAAEVPQGSWLRRLGVGALRMGQGGGMVGRKVYLKTRDMLQPIKILLRRKKRRGQSDLWEVSRAGVEKSQAPQRKPRRTKAQMIQDGFSIIKRQVGRPRIRPIPFPPLPKYLFEALTYEPHGPPDSTPPTAAFPSPALAPTPNPIAPSPVPYLSPAPALLHTAPLPPLVPSAQEDSAERFECLLQDIMMDLDLIPNVAVATQTNDLPQETAATAPPPASPHLHGNRDHSAESFNQLLTLSALSAGHHSDINNIIPTAFPVAEATTYGVTSRSECEVPLLQQQQTEGDLSDILDHFLLSFEQQVASSANNVLNGNIQTDSSHTDRPPEPYAAMRNDSGAQTQTRPAEHGAQTSSVFELTHAVVSPHSARHTAHQQHTHTQYGEEPDPVRHYPLTHTTLKPPSSALLSQPAKAVPSTGQPSHIQMAEKLVEEGRRMTRSQVREGIRTSEEARGVKRFPPALEQTQRQQSEEESTKTHPSQSQPSKPPHSQSQPSKPPHSQSQPTKPPHSQSQPTIPPPSQSQPSKPPPSQSLPTKPPHSQSQPTKPPHSQSQSTKTPSSQSQPSKPPPSQSQPTKPHPDQTESVKFITNSQPIVRIKPLPPRDQLKSICSRKQDRDKTRHLVRKIKQLQSMCPRGQKLERYATVCLVRLEDTQLLAGTSGKRLHPAEQPIRMPEKVSVQTVQPIRVIEALKLGGGKERRRFLRRSVDRCPSAPSPGTAENRGENSRENRRRKGEENRLSLESETDEPKRRKEEEREEDKGAERETACPDHPEPVKSNPVSQRRLSSPKLQLPAQRHRAPAQNGDESGKKGPVTVELDEEVDAIHVTAATRFEKVREVLCSQSRGADKERVCGRPEGGEDKEEETNWAVFRHQETPSSEEDIDVVELDSAGSVHVVVNGGGEKVEGGAEKVEGGGEKCDIVSSYRGVALCVNGSAHAVLVRGDGERGQY